MGRRAKSFPVAYGQRQRVEDNLKSWPPKPAYQDDIPVKKIRVHWRKRLRWAVLVGLFPNVIGCLIAARYFLLPQGTVILMDGTVFVIIEIVAFFVGIPACVWFLWKRRQKKQWFIWEIVGLLLCLSPVFVSTWLWQKAGNMRHLNTPCYPCDGSSPAGEDTMPWSAFP